MPTWMVVEDEPDIYDVLLAMFEIWGIEGVAFVDGAEAVSWIDDVDKGSVTGELPELAILDIRLPEVPGPEVGARLRRSERLGKIAIVMITAYRLTPDEEEQIKARAQADTLMYKPLPVMSELRRELERIITERRKKSTGSLATKPAPHTKSPTMPIKPPAPSQAAQPVQPPTSSSSSSAQPSPPAQPVKPKPPSS